MEEQKIRDLIKKVRKWCIIATIIVLVVGAILTTIKVRALGGSLSAGMDELHELTYGETDPEGDGRVLGGFLSIFTAGVGSIVLIGLIIVGIIKTILIVAIIWIGFLIFYLIERSRIKKINNPPIKEQKQPENELIEEPKEPENNQINS